LIIDKSTKKILKTNFSFGRTHDFKVFKQTKLSSFIKPSVTILADTGYLGIKSIHDNSKIPYKKTKHNKLTKEEREFNHRLSKQRIVIENVIGDLKVFQILSSKYRNGTKKLRMRFNLICGIVNSMII
jgi:hypothetical protein